MTANKGKTAKVSGKRRNLYLLRHAKSDWKQPGTEDIDRPLNERGRAAASGLGKWMEQHGLLPKWVICSPAARTRETLDLLRSHLKIPTKLIDFDDKMYLADLGTLLAILGESPQDAKDILLLGHNPGMEELLTHLCGTDVPRSQKDKIMPTATLAKIALPDDWHRLAPLSGKLMSVVRPEDIK
jgi:phosphohistidine phosphatase